VLVIGGSQGFSGAVRLAGEAALRAGAGLVTLATHPEHAAIITSARPELMCHGVADVQAVQQLIDQCDVILLGPGLGQDEWARMLFDTATQSDKPMVMDADALNILAGKAAVRHAHRILTPHPGEAARLLERATSIIQHDRFTAASDLVRRFGGITVLKGAGTIIANDGMRPPAVSSEGNAGMASAGMGDVLGGVIAALIGQGLDLDMAAETGVALHAAAADISARNGQKGMIASDLFTVIRNLLG
jgi:NAD(P)H-hydrate epimerase